MIRRDTDIASALQSRQRQRAMIEGRGPRVSEFIINSYAGAGGAPPSDPYFANVSFLAHGDVFPFVDSSSSPKTITAGSGVTLTTTTFKFGGGAFSFSGGSSPAGVFSVPISAAFQVGAGDFTWEGWLRTNSATLGQTPFFYGNDGNYFNAIALDYNTSGQMTFSLFDGSAGDQAITPASTVVAGVFQFVSVCRGGGRLFIHVDGTPRASVASTRTVGVPSTGPTVSYGARYGASLRTSYWNGQMDDLRFTKGVARYADGVTYTPPSSAFPNF